MSDDIFRLILQVLGVILGGGTLNFILTLVRRRSETHALDAKADADTVTAQTGYIVTLQHSELSLRKQVSDLNDQLDTMRIDHAASMDTATREINRLRYDLAVAQSQIAQLADRMPGRHRPEAGEGEAR
jgi:hypothetical protein